MNPPKGFINYLTSSSLTLLFAGVAGIGLALVLARTPLIVSFSCFTIACSLWLMQKTAGVFNLRTVTIPGLSYLLYFVDIVVPSFFVFAAHPGPFRLTYLFAVESALLTIPLGILFATLVFRFHRCETAAFFNSPVQENPSDPGQGIYIFFLVLAWALTLLYVLEVRTIPLFYMLGHAGEPEHLGRLREESMKLLDSPLRYAYEVLKNAVYPLLIVLALGRYLQTKQRSWGALFLASLISGVLYAGFTIAKAPVAIIFLLVFLYIYLHRGGRAGPRLVVLGLVVVFAFPLLVSMQLYSGGNVMSHLEGLGERIFYLPAEVLYYYFEVFPEEVPYQHGKTIQKLAMLLGEQAFDSENYVGRYMRPDAFYSINANAAFLGNLNADFGIPGVLAGGFLVGLIMQVAQIYLVRRGKSVLILTIYAILLHSFGQLDSSSLPAALLSGGPVFVLLIAWVMTFLNSMILSALRIRRRAAHLENPHRVGPGELKVPRGGLPSQFRS